MNPHPLIHSELARQRELQLRSPNRPRTGKQHKTELTPLVEAAKAGDAWAWESLVERFTPALRNVVRGFRASAADTDDVVQAAWVSAFANIGRLVEPEAIGGWLSVIARREALRTLERRRREVLCDEPSHADTGAVSGPERAVLATEQRDAVHAAIRRLPPHQRRLVRALLQNETSSYADLPHRLAIPVGSIGPTRERAFARLRRNRPLNALVTHDG